MAKSASSPKKKSSLPLLLGGGVVLLLIVTMTGGGDEPAATTSKKAKKTASSKDDQYDTPADHNAHFAAVTYGAKDVFTPLIKKAVIITPPKDQVGGKGGIPANMTGGEANWYYTGLVELNGVRQALLENTTSGETAYVGVGDSWKAARVVSIDVGVIELSGPNAVVVKSPLTPYGEMPGVTAPVQVATNGAPQPLNVPGGAISGQIGGIGVRPVAGAQANGAPGLQPQNGQTMATIPPDANVQGDNSNGNSRRGNRRNRRNRNNNQDPQGFNNVP